MARKCTICEHKKRKEIDSALVRPDAVLRTISHQWGVSIDSLKRHVKNGHILDKIAKAAHAHEALEADDLLGEIKETEEITKQIIDAAMKRETYDRNGNLKPADHEIALKAIAQRGKQIELKGRVLGAFKEKPPGGDGKPVNVQVYIPDNKRKGVA